MVQLVTLATCSLNQWALDWDGNLERILTSIRQAKAAGATLRTGPELEITGYGCLDHFLESDVYELAMESLLSILGQSDLHGILIDVGLPVMHRGNRFNCRALCLDGQLLCLRPKMYLANDGNFRENRFFVPWGRPRHVEQFSLPPLLKKHQNKRQVPIGDVILSLNDTTLAAETCEELFTPAAPHITMGLNGVEVFTNSSGSHHSLRKLNERVSLIEEATRKNGGIYLYANSKGCDGDRLLYDGCAMILVNGEIVAQGAQFSLLDVEVVTATVDLEKVRSFRSAPSRGFQAIQAPIYERLEVDFQLCRDTDNVLAVPTPAQIPRYHLLEEEIALGPACWLWDYLRRSGAAGFLLPLSGGIDSCATATIVFSMCRLVVSALGAGNQQVREDVKRIAAFSKELPRTAEDLCGQIFHTLYMGMKNQSSQETRKRAQDLATRIGSYHKDPNIDEVFGAAKGVLSKSTGFNPRFSVHGGGVAENLALQNIQSRERMVISYYFASLLPTIRQRPGGGSLLVLGSSNVDEYLRGYLTKYDNSSADLNPIGGLSKLDLKSFLAWATLRFNMPILSEFISATPTAELEPITETYTQTDEDQMGMTYAELSIFGSLRKQEKLGPCGMFERLVHEWGPGSERKLSPREVADKVKRFFYFHKINRHKQTVATPAYHAESYSPDDHRFDLRPFLYPPAFGSREFSKIDDRVAVLEKALEQKGK
ncbi:glutamine-dependent NAD(+) synthetase with GAT domain-containing protein [Nemania sp. FL0916]|nr:glutamine-dependent NAD(+) synthetase with GAT domain-containing protein [Nemania sp. FL0916]